LNITLASLTRVRHNLASVDAGTGIARPWDPNLNGPVNALAPCSAPAGRSKVAWSGRIRRRALKPGRYVLRARATDLAGNAGRRRSLSIRIVRRGR
jgi:hypothetical protein